jgi:hypothetical protein
MDNDRAIIPVTVSGPTVFRAEEITRYETILADRKSTEHDVSHFFQEFPKFFWFDGPGDIKREVVLQEKDGHLSRVDFFKRKYGRKYWDIIELKGPAKPLVSGAQTDHSHLSAVFDAAVNQARDYRDLLMGDANLRARLESAGIIIYRPQLAVIVGQEPKNIQRDRLEVLFDRYAQSGVNALSYTDILAFAKEHYEREKLIILPAPRIVVPAGETFEQRVHVLLESIRETMRFDNVELYVPGRGRRSEGRGFRLIQSLGNRDRERSHWNEKQRDRFLSRVYELGRERLMPMFGSRYSRDFEWRPDPDGDLDESGWQNVSMGVFPLYPKSGILVIRSWNWKIIPEEELEKTRPLIRRLGEVMSVERSRGVSFDGDMSRPASTFIADPHNLPDPPS